MKIAIQVPIKARASVRVPGKNFAPLAGRPLFAWLLSELMQLSTPVDVWIDSEDPSTFERIDAELPGSGFGFHQRHEWFAGDTANGNHLLTQFAYAHPGYDLYAQSFVTAVGLTAPVIDEALGVACAAVATGRYDSLFLAHLEPGLIWYQNKPVNQVIGRPDGLPRTQDAQYVRETTGLYVITRDALFATGCRIGRSPKPWHAHREAAIDIDTPEDWEAAERIMSARNATQQPARPPVARPYPLPVTRPMPQPQPQPAR